MPLWDDNAEEHGKKYDTTIANSIFHIQRLFSERLEDWERHMAPHGWQRQERWRRRDWARLIFMSLRANTAGRYARRRALRRIGAVLIDLYRDSNIRLMARWASHVHRVNRHQARVRINCVLWEIYHDPVLRGLVATERYGEPDTTTVHPIERWVDQVHHDIDDHIVPRIIHAMRCLISYVSLVTRPVQRRHAQQQQRARDIEKARRTLLKRAYSIPIYKNELQQEELRLRATRRLGLVCANTRQAGSIIRQSYDESQRRGKRIESTEVYRLHRWPRRDKCGPTLVGLLYHIWGIT